MFVFFKKTRHNIFRTAKNICLCGGQYHTQKNISKSYINVISKQKKHFHNPIIKKHKTFLFFLTHYK